MKINPSYIRAYRNMGVSIKPMVPSDRNTGKVSGTTKQNPVEIKGAEFSGYLSKAERSFISEKFAAQRPVAIKPDAEVKAKTIGRYLDVKA